MVRFSRTLLPLFLLALATPVAAQDPASPPAPDYADAANWVRVTAQPEGAGPVARQPQVDVFYLHPTTVRAPNLFNMDPADADQRKWTDESAVLRQASAFAGCCRIFAPRYRAGTYTAFAAGKMESTFALAYQDVERAFRWYLAHENHGRPFILVGHSQGAAHTATLLERAIAGTPLQRQLVAAYVLGIPLAEGEFARRFGTIRPCTKPAQTGCVVTWNAMLAGSNLDPVVAAYTKLYTGKYGEGPGSATVCINPVTYDADKPRAVSADAAGAVPGDPGFGPMRPLRVGAVAVQCDRGVAVTYLAPGMGAKPLPNGSLHYYDVALFWADLRANAMLRSQAWLRAHKR